MDWINHPGDVAQHQKLLILHSGVQLPCTLWLNDPHSVIWRESIAQMKFAFLKRLLEPAKQFAQQLKMNQVAPSPEKCLKIIFQVHRLEEKEGKVSKGKMFCENLRLATICSPMWGVHKCCHGRRKVQSSTKKKFLMERHKSLILILPCLM